MEQQLCCKKNHFLLYMFLLSAILLHIIVLDNKTNFNIKDILNKYKLWFSNNDSILKE